ncbi:MAG TPA: hypothetical protein PKJ74_07270, partial [Chitinophagales bacterium]|nr:hypothetical protein [Chitinophagales bacterium]
MSKLTIIKSSKCALCNEIVQSPILLPCNHAVCLDHVNQAQYQHIACSKCQKQYAIPPNIGSYRIDSLNDHVNTEIYRFNFGDVHKSASES